MLLRRYVLSSTELHRCPVNCESEDFAGADLCDTARGKISIRFVYESVTSVANMP